MYVNFEQVNTTTRAINVYGARKYLALKKRNKFSAENPLSKVYI